MNVIKKNIGSHQFAKGVFYSLVGAILFSSLIILLHAAPMPSLKYGDLKIMEESSSSHNWIKGKVEEEIRMLPTNRDTNISLDKNTAILLAEIILVKIYGVKVLEQRPWIIEEKENVFYIKGTFTRGIMDKNAVGGVAYIAINKSNGKVEKVIHGK